MKKLLVQLVALLIVAGLAVPLAAKPVSKSIRLAQAAKIGKTEVTAGEYRLFIDNDRVTIKKGKNVVAEVLGRWEERENKYSRDAYVLNRNGQLEEVRFAGDRRVLVLLNP
jgi:hypothetical protein